MGPGIRKNSTFDFLGTQVDYAPTFLALANIAPPPHMDGANLVPLLVQPFVAAAQGEVLPGSVARSLARTAAAPARDASFHEYYNQGPWETGCGNLPKSNWCKPARHRLDDWSNTWAAVVYAPAPVDAPKLLYKYGVFDPWGKQSYFADPYMHVLFNLTADPYELDNIYNATRRTKQGAALIATLEEKLTAYKTCQGDACRAAGAPPPPPPPFAACDPFANLSLASSVLQLRGPASRADAPAWLADMRRWRARCLTSLHLNGSAFDAMPWARTAFMQPLAMTFDRFLFNETTHAYTTQKYLASLREQYGGIDSVLIWPTYTNIGADDRNQFELVEAMPSGIPGLKSFIDELHAAGVHVLWPYNPWDQARAHRPPAHIQTTPPHPGTIHVSRGHTAAPST
jgi:hypothetical protein